MPRQPELLSTSDLRITPQPGMTEPRLWVKRLVLWREPGNVIRQIELRPGLNIVWSPDPVEEAAGRRTRASTMGHGSGKTLFCRLIRYCLGEDRFAPEEQRESIGIAFPKGAVGAEVMVDGTLWAILRPLGMGRKHYGIPNGDLEEIINGNCEPTGIEPFMAAMESGIVSADVASLIPGDRSFHGWQTALASLTRDQECRFDKALEWRSSDSESGSPARSLSYQKTLEVLRALIRAITPEECRLREEIGQNETRLKDSDKEIGHRRWQVRRTKTQLVAQLGIRPEQVPPGLLGIDFIRQSAKEVLVRATKIKPGVDVANVGKIRAASEAAEKAVVEHSTELAMINAKLPEIERLISELNGERPGMSFVVHKAENPQCPICEVPIDRVLAEGCKLSHKLPSLEEIRTRLAKLEKDIKDEQQRFLALKARKLVIEDELPGAEKTSEELKNQLVAIEQAREARTDTWYSARRMLDDINDLEKLVERLEQLQSESDSLSGQIEEKKGRLGAFRKAQANVFNRLSDIFDALIRQMAGRGADGTVSLDGNGLRLSVKLGGERSTPAIASLKVIVFDLALLCLSIEGRTHLPPFLIHDSPREADLGLSIYHELFHVVKDLEGVGGQPLFQYIITTTTRPPDEFLKEPWLRGTLGGAPADARLLRRDL
ncbi:chromosome segregation protein SMC [Oryzomonas rubra]|uniref:Chromosome segregation protein SMC n=1 Tax=Oryzomonas rubra TaxID=2509454 RepID=A0A5A9XSB1_9BACT|nr:chromosome segregation protein SMC [Oryzomonas rubra]KAA0895463.1 chromosome segregation protein SMC [Oryzomonas rubra]